MFYAPASLDKPRAAAVRRGLRDCSPTALHTVARFPIHSRSGIALQPIIGFTQLAQVVDVLHEAGEPRLLILHGCLPYPPQRTLHDFPVQCPVRVLPWRLSFGQTPSLHPLRHWRVGISRPLASFVRGLRRYYESV